MDKDYYMDCNADFRVFGPRHLGQMEIWGSRNLLQAIKSELNELQFQVRPPGARGLN